MKCENCNSDRVLSIGGKSNDLNTVLYGPWNVHHNGYLPTIIGLCSGGEIDIDICLQCKAIQQFKPINDEELKEIFEGGNVDCSIVGPDRLTEEELDKFNAMSDQQIENLPLEEWNVYKALM